MWQETERSDLEADTAPDGFVLIVENDEFSRDRIARQLNRAGFAAVLADSGQQALGLLDRRQFDMVLLMPGLPDMDEVELLELIRRRYSSVELPVIAILPAGSPAAVAESLRAGASDCIVKPIEPDVLSSRLEIHMAPRRARRVSGSPPDSRDPVPAGDLPAQILEAIGERFVIWDSNDRLVACNQRYRELFGKNADEVMPGVHFERLAALLAHGGFLRNAEVRPEDWLSQYMARHREPGAVVEEEFVDGSWARITGSRAANGQTVDLWTDITEVKRREIALKTFAETNRRLAAAINATTSAILITDARRSGNPTIFANPAFARMTGWPVEEALGRDRKFLNGSSTDVAELARFEEQIAAGLPATAELCLRTRTGRAFWAEINASPIQNHTGETVNWVIIQTDISARKQAEEQLRQSQKMETIGQLTSGLAHDFNNLLTIILGNIEDALDDKTAAATDSRANLQDALTAARRGAELTARMLAFARRQSWSPRETDVGQTAQGVQDLLSRSLGPSIRIESRLEEKPWPVLVDPVQLENAILNLALNARDAMPGGGTLTIEVTNLSVGAPDEIATDGFKGGDYVRILVGDTGTGMTPGTIAKATQHFFTTKPAGKGTGLGLSMVHGLVSESQGHMRIESVPGAGTRIELYLPRRTGDPRRESAGRQEPISGGQEVILLVDDEPQVRAITAIQLKRLGYKVLQADGGAQALDLIGSRQSVDLLVTDIDLPGDMTGVDLAATVRGQNPDVRVLYVSGYADGDWDGGLRRESGTPFLPKPYDSAALARAVRTALHVA